MGRVAGLILLIVLAGVPAPPRADTASSSAAWWAVIKIDIQIESVSRIFLSIRGPLPTWEQCNFIVEDTRAGFTRDQPQYRASDPPVELTLSVARCQTGVVITKETNSLWWTISTVNEVFGTTPVQYFAYQGPHVSQKACNDALADVAAHQTSVQRSRDVSTTCGQATITY